jgi:hypothetical protein
MLEDIKVWLTFLSEYNGVTVTTDNAWASNETLELFTDSAGGQNRGFGIYFQGKWAQKCWPKEWEEMGILKHITFLELFRVVVALCIWGEQLKNKKIIFNIDNQSVVHIINKKSSKSVRVMSLVFFNCSPQIHSATTTRNNSRNVMSLRMPISSHSFGQHFCAHFP